MGEPTRVAQTVKELELNHAVITMVNRDDLDHGGSVQMAMTVQEIRRIAPGCTIELLSSDMMARRDNIARMVDVKPEILSHNLETVERLTPLVRSRSEYRRSLQFLEITKQIDPECLTKSSLMLGLGEEKKEILQTLKDLKEVGVSVVNLGQYLQPTPKHLMVKRYWTPEEFQEIKVSALEMGFRHVEAGPMVRSSYHAGEQFNSLEKL